MNFDISYETALMIFATAYIAPLILLAVSNIGIVMLEALEDVDH